ncbi:MAG: hypothetical protein WCF12_10520 [Propionicimonas sp.]
MISYEVLMLAAMVAVAARVVRGRSGWPRWMAVVAVAAAVGSMLLFVFEFMVVEVGLWQRFWLAEHLAWLLLVTWLPARETPAASGRW